MTIDLTKIANQFGSAKTERQLALLKNLSNTLTQYSNTTALVTERIKDIRIGMELDTKEHAYAHVKEVDERLNSLQKGATDGQTFLADREDLLNQSLQTEKKRRAEIESDNERMKAQIKDLEEKLK